MRGSNGIDYKERIKIMKLLWDAIGSEFGARHELYEMNYSGSHELIRVFQLQQAQGNGTLKQMDALVDAMHGRLRRERLGVIRHMPTRRIFRCWARTEWG